MLMFRKALRYVFSYRLSKRIFNTLLPAAARQKIASGLDLDTGPQNRPIDNVNLFLIQADAYLATYAKYYGTDVGVGVSLYLLDNEVMRFDCFGTERGHFHALPCMTALPGSQRIDFDSPTIDGQIAQTATELLERLDGHLAGHFRRRIKEFELDREAFASAVASATERMRRDYAAVREIARAPAAGPAAAAP